MDNRGDDAEFLKNWRPLAEQGDAFAQYNLGVSYAKGDGVPQDHAEAARWWHLAADQGHAMAQSNLGTMYDNGHGVPKDDVLAYMWFNLAAAQGDEDAIKNRDIVAKEMTPAQIAKAQALAREWQPKR